jgi:transposase InsO family protein
MALGGRFDRFFKTFKALLSFASHEIAVASGALQLLELVGGEVGHGQNLIDHSASFYGLSFRRQGHGVGQSNAKLFLAVVIDLFARFVVGWSVSAVNDRHLVMKALDMAIRRRCPDTGLLHHSDRGSPYASEDYQKVLAANGIIERVPEALQGDHGRRRSHAAPLRLACRSRICPT